MLGGQGEGWDGWALGVGRWALALIDVTISFSGFPFYFRAAKVDSLHILRALRNTNSILLNTDF